MIAPGALELRLLGRFVVLREGREIATADFGGRKVRVLLRILATRRGVFVSHDVLTELLWDERPPADPRANLQVLVNRARRALGRGDLLVTGPRGYCLVEGPGCEVDAEAFLRAIDTADRLDGRPAVAAYRDALAGWRGDPLLEDAYSEWADDYRERLHRARQHALERAAELALRVGPTALAVDLASTAATLEPLREIAVLTLVRALAAGGDRVAALNRYDQYRRALAEDLGLDPSDEAVSVQAQLLQAHSDDRARETARRVRPDFGALPFVGRSTELDSLLSAMAGGDTVLLSGVSGTGKSRLLSTLASRAPVLLVRAFRAERDEPWSLVRGLLREILETDATAAGALPASSLAALAWVLPDLASASAADVVAPDPESRRPLLLEATCRLLKGAAAGLVIDDLQWADASSVWLIEAATNRLGGVGAVFAYRPDELWDGSVLADFVARTRPAATTIVLPPFDAADIAGVSADAALTDVLSTVTDRTPLAVTEVLRALADEGAVIRTADQRWRAVGTGVIARARELAVDGQRAAILARVAAQDRAARELANLLALVGREVPARVLAVASERAERDVLDTLGILAHGGLCRLGEQGWATAHDMVSDALVADLSPSERGRLHARLADALDTVDAEPSELARHWVGAGDTLRGATCFDEAARRALDAFVDEDAMALVAAGLELGPPPEIRAALHETRARARGRLGDIAGAVDDVRQALRVHGRGPIRSRLLGRLAALASGSDDLVRAAELAESALVEAGADAAARARALEVASVLDMNLDRAARAETRAAEALTLFQQLGDANGAARILDARAMATFLGGQVGLGTALLDRAATLFEDSGDLVHVITPRSTAGHGLVFADRAPLGLRFTTAALDLARAIGNPEGQSYALWHTAEALAALDRGDDALEAGTEALAIATRIAHRGWTATAWRAIGIARQARAEPDAALVAFQHSLDASEHLNLFASWAAARSALVLVELSQLSRAALMVDRALGEGPEIGHFEARLAEVELAAARADPRTPALARTALAAADAAGVGQGRARLAVLVDHT